MTKKKLGVALELFVVEKEILYLLTTLTFNKILDHP